jgi:hypothetical protein
MIGLNMKEYPYKKESTPQLTGTGFVPLFDSLFCLIIHEASICLAQFGRISSSFFPRSNSPSPLFVPPFLGVVPRAPGGGNGGTTGGSFHGAFVPR